MALKKPLRISTFIRNSALALSCAACFYSAASYAASPNYNNFVKLADDWRDAQEPIKINGVADYTPRSIRKRLRALDTFRERLKAIDTSQWSTSEKVDHHLIRAEMNGLYFRLAVQRPWARDAAFYLPNAPIDGPKVQIPDLHDDFPASAEEVASTLKGLKAIPEIYKRAKRNLADDASAEMADLALGFLSQELAMYDDIIEGAKESHPELVPHANKAKAAVVDFGKWLKANKPEMTEPAGIGEEEYNWLFRNVYLIPYTWEESKTLIENEYDRVITDLKLEEHRNRNYPPLTEVTDLVGYHNQLVQSVQYSLDFIRANDIVTVPDWLEVGIYVDPEDIYAFEDDVYIKSADAEIRRRQPLPGEGGHEFIGHAFDNGDVERSTHPIRQHIPLFDIQEMRDEGWAAFLEESLMQVGMLDESPRRSKEIVYLMNSSHVSYAMADLNMHSQEMTLPQAARLTADLMPRGWSNFEGSYLNSPELRELLTTLRRPGFHSMNLVGKAYIMKMFKEQARKQGDKFVLKHFIDQFRAPGMIPPSLIRMEMTGDSSEIDAMATFDDHNPDPLLRTDWGDDEEYDEDEHEEDDHDH